LRKSVDQAARFRLTLRLALLAWTQDCRVDWAYIQPGKPTQNAFAESCNGRLRDDYNHERPHSALAWQTPAKLPRFIGHRLWSCGQRKGVVHNSTATTTRKI
jgi:transposase InsO family protein